MKVSAIIPAAGAGKRFGGSVPKQYMEIDGQPVIALTLQKFVLLNQISEGVVVTAKDEVDNTAGWRHHQPTPHIAQAHLKTEVSCEAWKKAVECPKRM